MENIKHVKCYKKNYPRPQFVKESFINLNGEWDFCFAGPDERGADRLFDKKINVPFSYQCAESGIGDTSRHDFIYYRREFNFAGADIEGKRLLLHFEGCDYITKVWVNGQYAGTHRGGYCRFSFDITGFIKDGINVLTVGAEDSYDAAQPRGKQRWQNENFGCWYEDTNGIWKTVWLETVPLQYLKSVKIVPDLDNESVMFTFDAPHVKAGLSVRAVVSFGGSIIADVKTALKSGREELKVRICDTGDAFKIREWANMNPNLYDVEFILEDGDKVIEKAGSYFAMRKISVHNGSILLNNIPVYLKMLLDQGYWRESHLTPPDEDALITDIMRTLQMGFNGIRKHQKIEDERFYYYCDILGVLVWCEMPSPYDFCDAEAQNFLAEWTEAVIQLRNHPCIMAWVPFNESWGIRYVFNNRSHQALSETAYFLTKTFDGENRPVISNDGWEHTRSDIITLHNYSETGEQILSAYADKDKAMSDSVLLPLKRVFASGYKYEGQPVIISEYGGIAFSKDKKKGWGYGNLVKDENEFLSRLEFLNKAIRSLPYVQGYCLTQTTDVMQEVNGLLNMDRTPKISVEEIKKLN